MLKYVMLEIRLNGTCFSEEKPQKSNCYFDFNHGGKIEFNLGNGQLPEIYFLVFNRINI